MALTVPAVGVGDDVLASWAAAAKAAIDDLYTVITDTTIGTAGAGWVTQTGTSARTALGGKLITVVFVIQRTLALTATAGNVTDETMFTLDAAYRPADAVNMALGTGTETGEAILTSAGLLQIRSLSDSSSAAANFRGMATYLLP
jgi:hypothetical protein